VSITHGLPQNLVAIDDTIVVDLKREFSHFLYSFLDVKSSTSAANVKSARREPVPFAEIVDRELRTVKGPSIVTFLGKFLECELAEWYASYSINRGTHDQRQKDSWNFGGWVARDSKMRQQKMLLLGYWIHWHSGCTLATIRDKSNFAPTMRDTAAHLLRLDEVAIILFCVILWRGEYY
jgi:hypothetical protein